MDKAQVDHWLDAYVSAWKSYDPDEIGSLFAEDVSYRYHPYDQPVEGREAVVQSWLGEGDHEGASSRDEPGTYDATYHTVALDGDVAVATGTSSYTGDPPTVFHNCFVMRFDPDGRCREFTEWYVQVPGR
jgi:ketosteroid isomerase-like protein